MIQRGGLEPVVTGGNSSGRNVLFLAAQTAGEWVQDRWNILPVTSCDEVLLVLQEGAVDAVVLDLDLHRGQVTHMLSILHANFPAVPKIAITACPASFERRRCLENGAWCYLEKPRSVEETEEVFATMNQLFDRQSEEGFHGTVRVAGLYEILQLECLHRRSSMLQFTSGPNNGRIFVDCGEIVHAQFDEVWGMPALTLALALTSGDFQVQRFQEPPERTTGGPWEFLLLEAAQKNDEEDANFLAVRL